MHSAVSKIEAPQQAPPAEEKSALGAGKLTGSASGAWRIAVVIAIVAAGAAGAAWWCLSRPSGLPPGIVQTNGRVEIQRVDIAAKIAGRVKEILVREGDLVEPGAVVARLDDADLRARLASARASLRRARQMVGKARAELGIRRAEANLIQTNLERARKLYVKGFVSRAEMDRRRAERDVAIAAIAGAQASIADALASTEAVEAQIKEIEVNIADLSLVAPLAGRVEYRLLQPGEVAAPGGRVVTLLDISDVFMTVFLPTGDAGGDRIGLHSADLRP